MREDEDNTAQHSRPNIRGLNPFCTIFFKSILTPTATMAITMINLPANAKFSDILKGRLMKVFKMAAPKKPSINQGNILMKRYSPPWVFSFFALFVIYIARPIVIGNIINVLVNLTMVAILSAVSVPK